MHCFLPLSCDGRAPIGRVLRNVVFPLERRVPGEVLALLERLAAQPQRRP